MYMTSFLLKNKIATPVRRRFSAAFTAVAAGAVPSVAGKDMQHEEGTLPAAPPAHASGESPREGSAKAEPEMAGFQAGACLAFAALKTCTVCMEKASVPSRMGQRRLCERREGTSEATQTYLGSGQPRRNLGRQRT